MFWKISCGLLLMPFVLQESPLLCYLISTAECITLSISNISLKIQPFILKCDALFLCQLFLFTYFVFLCVHHSQLKLSFDIFSAGNQKLRSQISCQWWSFLVTFKLLMLHLYAAVFDLKEPFLISSSAIVCIIFDHVFIWLVESLLCAAEDS